MTDLTTTLIAREDTSPLTGRAADLAAGARPPNTTRAYDGQLARYVAWSAEAQREPWEDATVAAYLAACYDRGAGVATLRQAATALRQAWRASGRQPERAWSQIVAGAETALVAAGRAHTHEAPPLRLDDWRAAMRALTRRPASLDWQRDARDRALLAIGYLAGLRRSELTALAVADIVEAPDGLVITIRGAKEIGRAACRGRV